MTDQLTPSRKASERSQARANEPIPPVLMPSAAGSFRLEPGLHFLNVSSNDEAMQLANESGLGLTAGFYGGRDEIAWFHEHIEAGVTYANRPQCATTGAWPGYQPFGGWKGSGTTGKAIASFYYLPQYLREQSQTVVE